MQGKLRGQMLSDEPLISIESPVIGRGVAFGVLAKRAGAERPALGSSGDP